MRPDFKDELHMAHANIPVQGTWALCTAASALQGYAYSLGDNGDQILEELRADDPNEQRLYKLQTMAWELHNRFNANEGEIDFLHSATSALEAFGRHLPWHLNPFYNFGAVNVREDPNLDPRTLLGAIEVACGDAIAD